MTEKSDKKTTFKSDLKLAVCHSLFAVLVKLKVSYVAITWAIRYQAAFVTSCLFTSQESFLFAHRYAITPMLPFGIQRPVVVHVMTSRSYLLFILVLILSLT